MPRPGKRARRAPSVGRRRGCGWSRRGGLTYSRIHQILQFLARLKERNLLGGDFHAVTGLGIASHARLALPGAEAAKAANLNLIAHAKRAHDAVKNGFDDDLTVFACQFRQPGDLVDQIRFCHTLVRSVVSDFASAWLSREPGLPSHNGAP